MGKAVDTKPTMHVRSLLDADISDGARIALDSNILIQMVDETHQYHRTTVGLIDSARRKKNLRFFYFLASKLEVLEYFRRLALLNYFRDFYQSGNSLGGTGFFDQKYRELVSNDGDQAFHVLNDFQIKSLRRDFLEDYAAAQGSFEKADHFWEQICRLALSKPLGDVDKKLTQADIVYASLQNRDIFPREDDPPTWKQQLDYMVRYGLGSNDAAIANMLVKAHGIHGFVTNDIDLLLFCRHFTEAQQLRCFTFVERFISSSTNHGVRAKKSS